MKKIPLIISCVFLAVITNAQERIERLFPLLGKCEGIPLRESIYQQETDSVPDKSYDVLLMPVEIKSLPPGIKDSIIAAFEYELSIASESDRYQKRRGSEDTLSYSLIYDKEEQMMNAMYNSDGVFQHHYTTDIYIAAKLDIVNGQLYLSYIREGSPLFRVWNEGKNTSASDTLQENNTEQIAIVFSEIATNSAVIKQPLSFDGSKNTSGYCLFQTNKFKKRRSKGVRLEVSSSLAEDAYAKIAAAMNKATFTGRDFLLSQEKNNIDIVFGKDCRGDAFLVHRAEDGRVYLFHKEPQEEGYDNAIPQNWYSEDYLENK